MRNILYIWIVVSILVVSCNKKNHIQQEVNKYHAAEISLDSILNFLSDSINVKDAFEWAQKYTGKDDFADFILGHAYKFGLGVESNIEKSKIYYRKAATAGNTNAMLEIANLYLYLHLNASYTEHEDLDSALYWYNEAAKNGNGEGFYCLSQIEINKINIKNESCDSAKAIEYLEKGVDLNNIECFSSLALAYYSGFGVSVNKQKSFDLLKKLINIISEEKLDGISNLLLGQIYESGEVTTQNFNMAFKYYKKAADLGHREAMRKLGNFYEFGQGVEKNDSLAFREYHKAANAGNPIGMTCVAHCYQCGIGVEPNISIAWHWYITAAKNGDIEAQKYCDQNHVDYQE